MTPKSPDIYWMYAGVMAVSGVLMIALDHPVVGAVAFGYSVSFCLMGYLLEKGGRK